MAWRDPKELEQEEQAVMKALRSGMTTRLIHKAADMPLSTVEACLRRLERKGRIKRVIIGGGRGSNGGRCSVFWRV